MSKFSNAGTYKAYPLITTADVAYLGDGHAFSVCIYNNSGAALTSGSVLFEGGNPQAGNPFAADLATFANEMVEPECDAAPGAVAAQAGITFSAQNPLAAEGQIHLSWPCAKRFIRLEANLPANVIAIVLVSQLRDQ